MHMGSFKNIVVTQILKPGIVHSEKGRIVEMTDRKWFGISLCISGQITYTMNGTQYVSHPGNAVLLPQGGTYSLCGDKEGLFPLINFHCENLDCRQIQVFPLENPQSFLKDFEAMQSLCLFQENRLKLFSLFYALLNRIDLSLAAERNPLQSVNAMIEEHLSDPRLSNAMLARNLAVSESHFRKLFTQYYHTTPRQYILELRLRKAKQLLADTPFTVTAIAESCGFSSLYHFCRAFKEKTGMTPTQYAKLHTLYRI